MPTNFRPGVLPDDEPRRDYGQEVGRAFDQFIQGRETIRAGDRAQAREGRAAEAHDFDMERGRFRYERELEDEGFFRPDAYDRTGAGQGPERGRGVQGAPGVQYPDVQGDAARFDPGQDPFEDQGIGIAGEFDRYREAGPQAMREPVLLPGQFNPATGFAPTAVYMPDGAQVRGVSPGQAGPGGPAGPRGRGAAPATDTTPGPPRGRTEIGGREYVRDPSRSSEAQERARAEQAFQQEVDRLIAAGVDPSVAPAVAEQGLAASFVRPEDEEGRVQYTREELLEAGVPEGAVDAALRNPALAERLIEEAHRRFSPRGPQPERPQDFNAALEIINEEYGEYDEEGYLVGYRLSGQERFRLAEQLAAGELDPNQLPQIEDVEEAPPPTEEEGDPWWRSITDAFSGARGASGQEPGLSYGTLPESAQARVDVAVDDIQELYPNAGEDTLREILGELGYSPGEIQIILERR